MDGQEWVEATVDILRYFNPKEPVEKVKSPMFYFIYKGVKISNLGQAEKIQEEETIPLYQRMHGGKEGKVVGPSS
jgi:hypothetical protein